MIREVERTLPQTIPAQETSCCCLWDLILRIVEWALRACFFMGFRELVPEVLEKRNIQILNHPGAEKHEVPLTDGRKVEAIFLPGRPERRTNGAVIFTLGKYYQNLHPANYEHFLESGADVILWNPLEKEVPSYASTLSDVIRYMQSEKQLKYIAIFSYCVSVQAAIGAAHELKDRNLSLIVDRGYGDATALATGSTVFAAIPCCQELIRKKFDCGAIDKIDQVEGDILFLSPEKGHDQVMDRWGGNLTRDLQIRRGERACDAWIELKNGDHWSNWDFEAWRRVQEFLADHGVIHRHFVDVDKEFFHVHEAPSCWKTTVIWYLTKSWWPFGCG